VESPPRRLKNTRKCMIVSFLEKATKNKKCKYIILNGL
jgi:hypothetical protein